MSSGYRLTRFFPCPARLPPEQVASVRQRLDARLDNLAELEQKPLNGTLSVYQALRTLSEQLAAIRNGGALLA